LLPANILTVYDHCLLRGSAILDLRALVLRIVFSGSTVILSEAKDLCIFVPRASTYILRFAEDDNVDTRKATD
jgi:hypothetical protein